MWVRNFLDARLACEHTEVPSSEPESCWAKRWGPFCDGESKRVRSLRRNSATESGRCEVQGKPREAADWISATGTLLKLINLWFILTKLNNYIFDDWADDWTHGSDTPFLKDTFCGRLRFSSDSPPTCLDCRWFIILANSDHFRFPLSGPAPFVGAFMLRRFPWIRLLSTRKFPSPGFHNRLDTIQWIIFPGIRMRPTLGRSSQSCTLSIYCQTHTVFASRTSRHESRLGLATLSEALQPFGCQIESSGSKLVCTQNRSNLSLISELWPANHRCSNIICLAYALAIFFTANFYDLLF